MNAPSDNIWIGTSGWAYDDWTGVLYEEGTSPDERLRTYTESFDTVEINSTFYRLPEQTTVERWESTAPEGFLFAVKASRFITHMKKLDDPEEPVANLLDVVESLADKLGPVLFQCPPNWRRNVERLGSFLDVLPRGHDYAFEFRDPSWFHDEVYDLLRAHDAAFCISEMEGETSPLEITANLIYVRFHKPEGKGNWEYDRRTLLTWASRFVDWADDGHQVFCYFNNDPGGAAVRNAWTLLEMLESGR